MERLSRGESALTLPLAHCVLYVFALIVPADHKKAFEVIRRRLIFFFLSSFDIQLLDYLNKVHVHRSVL